MDEYTFGMLLGVLIGIAIGVSIGFAIGKKQKPWSELTDEEKKLIKTIISGLVVILSIGAIVNLWLFFNW